MCLKVLNVKDLESFSHKLISRQFLFWFWQLKYKDILKQKTWYEVENLKSKTEHHYIKKAGVCVKSWRTMFQAGDAAAVHDSLQHADGGHHAELGQVGAGAGPGHGDSQPAARWPGVLRLSGARVHVSSVQSYRALGWVEVGIQNEQWTLSG